MKNESVSNDLQTALAMPLITALGGPKSLTGSCEGTLRESLGKRENVFPNLGTLLETALELSSDEETVTVRALRESN